jgi:hypothetical protein
MENTPLKNAFVTASFLVAVGYLGTASAHEQVDVLGEGEVDLYSKVVELYQVTCSTDAGGETGRLAFQISNDSPNSVPLLSVQVYKGVQAQNSTDPIGGDAVFSSETYLNDSNGSYIVMVDKTAPGAVIYTLAFHCQTLNGIHTGTSIIALQNQ